MYIDDRALYGQEGNVPDEMYEVEIGRAIMPRRGGDITIVTMSSMVPLVLEATQSLEAAGIDAEVIDLRSIKPWDTDCVLTSVAKTGRLLIVDEAWKTCGVAAEIAATVADEAFDALLAPIRRTTLHDVPAPASQAMEAAYYLSSERIVADAAQVMSFSRARRALVAPRTAAA
jgi:pyruvate dehydrogenase E1 component beta subunit